MRMSQGGVGGGLQICGQLVDVRRGARTQAGGEPLDGGVVGGAQTRRLPRQPGMAPAVSAGAPDEPAESRVRTFGIGDPDSPDPESR